MQKTNKNTSKEWAALREWSKHVDERDLSDEAHWWAQDERETIAMPANEGEWMASLEMAFEAGRMLEQNRAALKGSQS